MIKHVHLFQIRFSWLAALAVCALMLFPATLEARGLGPEIEHQEMSWDQAKTQVQFEFSIFLPFIDAEQLPSSFDLIDAAQERGEIGEETALTYAVFATFGDERLPWRFQGDNSGVIDSDAVAEATLRFADLSPATRETLVPFLIPPVYAGSWYDLRQTGPIGASQVMTGPVDYITDRCKELAQGLLVPLESDHFVVWYPPFDTSFAVRALQISLDLETRIDPILSELFRQPLGDVGLGCNPSDGRLDVYLVYDQIPTLASALAAVSVYPGQTCRAAPTFMLVLKAHPFETSVIAHEFMHMIQYAYNPAAECYENWWMEATADWAMDYFDTMDPQPDQQFEHESAVYYLRTAYLWLVDTEGLREYGAYLWPFYLSHYTGSYRPELIAEIFAATENAANGTLYQVIDDRIAGGWAQRWPEFALFNLNLSPHNQYEQWDQFAKRWQTDWIMAQTFPKLGFAPFWMYYLNSGSVDDVLPLPDLGIFYQEFAIDNDVRLWAFANEHAGDAHIKVQALLRREGQGWTGPEDWSGRKWTIGCQDDPAERVQKILLIFSNANWQRLNSSTGLSNKTRLVVSDLPCNGWQGTANWQINGESRNPDSILNYTIRGEATPTFTLKSRKLVGDTLQLEYQPTAGTATWTTTVEGRNLQTGQTTSCTRTGQQFLSSNMGGLMIVENLLEDLEGDIFSRKFFGAGLMPAPNRCPRLDSWTHVPWLSTDVANSGLLLWPETATVGRLQGSDSLSESGEDFSHTTTSAWDLRALPPK